MIHRLKALAPIALAGSRWPHRPIPMTSSAPTMVVHAYTPAPQVFNIAVGVGKMIRTNTAPMSASARRQ